METIKRRVISDKGEIVFVQFKREMRLAVIGISEQFNIDLSHDDALTLLANLKTDIKEQQRQHRANLTKRDHYRNTLCVGCRHNYYNFPKDRSPNGDVAVPDDYYCWSIPDVKRGKCSAHSKKY